MPDSKGPHSYRSLLIKPPPEGPLLSKEEAARMIDEYHENDTGIPRNVVCIVRERRQSHD